jgi:molecular chaperone DnaK (HSP70)
MPFVQAAVAAVFAEDRLRTTLDRVCATAIGAAVAASRVAVGPTGDGDDVAQELVDAEVRMQKQDDDIHKVS